MAFNLPNKPHFVPTLLLLQPSPGCEVDFTPSLASHSELPHRKYVSAHPCCSCTGREATEPPSLCRSAWGQDLTSGTARRRLHACAFILSKKRKTVNLERPTFTFYFLRRQRLLSPTNNLLTSAFSDFLLCAIALVLAGKLPRPRVFYHVILSPSPNGRSSALLNITLVPFQCYFLLTVAGHYPLIPDVTPTIVRDLRHALVCFSVGLCFFVWQGTGVKDATLQVTCV